MGWQLAVVPDMFSLLYALPQSAYAAEMRLNAAVKCSPPYDARAVANLLLDLAQSEFARPITNLALQKLLYFAHGQHLIGSGTPLVNGAFEAWTYGPVHPAIYREFKQCGANPITERAVARDVMTGKTSPIAPVEDQSVRDLLRGILFAYGRLSAGRLVDISHAKYGPWWTTVNKAETSIALGLRISDTVTRECFKFQKVTVGLESRVGEPDEDSPIERDRLGALLRHH